MNHMIWVMMRCMSGKNLHANAGGAKDPVLIPGSGRSSEQEVATHSSIPAWQIPQRDLVGYSSWHCKEQDTAEHAKAKKQAMCQYRFIDSDKCNALMGHVDGGGGGYGNSVLSHQFFCEPKIALKKSVCLSPEFSAM